MCVIPFTLQWSCIISNRKLTPKWYIDWMIKPCATKKQLQIKAHLVLLVYVAYVNSTLYRSHTSCWAKCLLSHLGVAASIRDTASYDIILTWTLICVIPFTWQWSCIIVNRKLTPKWYIDWMIKPSTTKKQLQIKAHLVLPVAYINSTLHRSHTSCWAKCLLSQVWFRIMTTCESYLGTSHTNYPWCQ